MTGSVPSTILEDDLSHIAPRPRAAREQLLADACLGRLLADGALVDVVVTEPLVIPCGLEGVPSVLYFDNCVFSRGLHVLRSGASPAIDEVRMRQCGASQLVFQGNIRAVDLTYIRSDVLRFSRGAFHSVSVQGGLDSSAFRVVEWDTPIKSRLLLDCFVKHAFFGAEFVAPDTAAFSAAHVTAPHDHPDAVSLGLRGLERLYAAHYAWAVYLRFLFPATSIRFTGSLCHLVPSF